MSLGATLTASFLVTLVRPTTWPLALAAFLLRGGIVIVLAPIVAIPSVVGVGNVLAPTITSIALGGLSPLDLAVVAGLALCGLLVLVLGALLAAAAEAEQTRIVASDDEVVALADEHPVRQPIAGAGVSGTSRGQAGRILAVRLVAFLPLGLVLIWGSVRVVSVAYRELTVPSETATPIVVRVLGGTSEVVALVIVAWLFGQIIGALGARQVVLRGASVRAALVAAIARLVRRPVNAVVIELVPLAVLVLVLVPSAAAAGTAWDAVRASLSTGDNAVASLGLIGLFVGLWIGGLVLAAVASAWRAAAWTVDAAGTFGATGNGREGDWNPSTESATLTDLRP